MKRYSFAAFPRHHQLEENPTGEWVRWEEVEEELRAIKQVIEDMRIELREAEESADRHRADAHHASMLND